MTSHLNDTQLEGRVRAGAIWFCASSRTGLGHLRRIVNIARALSELPVRLPHLGLMTNASVAGLDEAELALFQTVHRVARDDMPRELNGLRPALVIADTIRIPELSSLQCPLVLVLRQVDDAQIESFSLRSRPWDLILIPIPPDHWRAAQANEIGMRVVPVGWIYRAIPRKAQRIDPQPVVLVCAGGGGNDESRRLLRSQMDPILANVRCAVGTELSVIQVLGPRSPVTARLCQTDHLLDPGPNLHQWFSGADVVISTAGYNSVLELAQTDVPAMLVPIGRQLDDQYQRARRWADQVGIAHCPEKPERSVTWIANQLMCRLRRAPVDLGPGGEVKAAREIASLLKR